MECGDEMTENTYNTIECLPLRKQLPEDRRATTTRDEQNKEGNGQEKDVEGGERVRMQPDEEGQTSTTLNSPEEQRK